MMAGKAEGEDGFVLLETLVAFVVLSVALAAAIGAVSQATLAMRRAGEATAAAHIAREVAAVQGGAVAAAGDFSGQAPGGAEWRLSARELPDDNPVPLFAVTIEVLPPRATQSYVFRSFVVGEATP